MVLILIGAVGLSLQAVIGLCFFISSIHERETRAAFSALFQLIAMAAALGIYLCAAWNGIFHHTAGQFLLHSFLAASLLLITLALRQETNPRALSGSKGYITGNVQRVDERDLVFARNRTLRPGSDQYKTYYEMRPENEAYDIQRRTKGGAIGEVGKIDSPKAGFEVAMAAACLSIPLHLSQPSIYNPEPHPIAQHFVAFDSPFGSEEATKRVKRFAKKLGTDLVGITKSNPDWVYSHRGEIFNDRWKDWGQPIELKHLYAIVFAEEMDIVLTMCAPHAPTLIESMREYAKGAFISTQL